MKKLLMIAAVLSLTACANTWDGAKEDGRNMKENTEETAEKGWDKTKELGNKAMEKTGNALERSGDYLQDKAN